MLVLEGVSRRFGDKSAVSNVDLRIEPGSFVGVVGPSGAGKSTLLRMVNRLVEPTAGVIRFDDRDTTRLSGSALRDWRAQCAMIFQQFNLVNRLDVITNVIAGRLNHMPLWRSLTKSFTDAERTMALRALHRLGIAEVALKRADALSGGQQQRVAFARAMMQEPRIILADEPIASLDPHNAKVVMDALRDINRRDGILVMCNLHTLDTARTYCDRIIGMANGRVVFDGAPAEFSGGVIEQIYGADGVRIDERMTSTSLDAGRAARPAPMPA